MNTYHVYNQFGELVDSIKAVNLAAADAWVMNEYQSDNMRVIRALSTSRLATLTLDTRHSARRQHT